MPKFPSALLLAALATTAAAAEPGAAADAPIDKRYGAWVALDAAGAVTTVEVEAGSSEVVADVVAGLVGKVAFAPATRAGAAVASEVPVVVGVRYTPDASGGFAAQLRWLRVEASQSLRMAPPRYPSKELRGAIGGWVLMGFVVGDGGRADPATVRVLDQGAYRDQRPLGAGHASAEAFAGAGREAVAQFMFRTAKVDGAPVAVELATPITFQPRTRPGDAPSALPDAVEAAKRPVPPAKLVAADIVLPSPATALPEPPPPGGRPDTLEITGSRMTRTIIQ